MQESLGRELPAQLLVRRRDQRRGRSRPCSARQAARIGGCVLFRQSSTARSRCSTTGARTARRRCRWAPSSTTRSSAATTASPTPPTARASGCRPRRTCPTAPGCAATRSASSRRSSGCGWATRRGVAASSRPTCPSCASPGWTTLGGIVADGRQLHAAARQRARPHALPVRAPAPHPPRLRRRPAAAADRGHRDDGVLQPHLHPGAAGRLAARGDRVGFGRHVHPARDRHVRLAGAARRRDGHPRSRGGSPGLPRRVHPRLHPDRRRRTR